MFNNVRNPQKTNRLIRTWVPTGNPRKPLACVWIDIAGTSASASSPEAVASNVTSGRQPLCA